jgi:Phage tail tube protein
MGYSSNDPRNYFAMAKQTAVGTEATTGFKFIKFLGDTGFDIGIGAEVVHEGGDGQDPGLVYKSETSPDGQVNAYARIDMWTYLSAWAMGSAAAVGTSAGVGTSVYVPNATIMPLTVEQAWGGGRQIDRVSDTILTGFQVEGEAGAPWSVTVPFIGGGTPYYRDGAASALTAVLESGDPAMYAGGAYLINGATDLDVTRWSVNFSREVDDNLRTVNTFRRKVIPLTRSLEVTAQVIWQDQAYYRQIQYGGGSVVPHELATGAFHAERQLVSSQLMAIDVPMMKFTDVSVNRLVPDGQTVLLDITAQAYRVATGLMQLRSVHNAISASSYLGPSGI